ncbi:hypothetical protein TYRP_005355 [Tyrophagus putrescentiae]|nr:hypothetical protein TYRP_005355 [Tyrophagus putrescentiae]
MAQTSKPQSATDPMEPKVVPWMRTHYTFAFATIQLVAAYSFLAVTTFGYLSWHQSFGGDDGGGVHHPNSFSPSSSSSPTLNRLITALRLHIFPLATLFTSYMIIMLTRAFNPLARNPLGSHEVAVHQLQNRILLNSIEQLPFFSLNVLVFAVDQSGGGGGGGDHLFYLLLPLITFFYTFGRVVYHAGYALHPKYRTFGFTVSFSPVAFLFTYNLFRVVGIV